jgi:hypothetical protein
MRKVQNNLLAAVLILTVIPTSVRVSQVVVEHCCSLICQKLLDAEVAFHSNALVEVYSQTLRCHSAPHIVPRR